MTAGPDRKVVYALLAIAALCLIGLGASLYRAKTTQLGQLHTELRAKESQLEEVKTKITKQPELEAKYASLQARLSVLEPTLPDNAYMPTFLRQIERLTVTTNNSIVAIRPKAKTGVAKKSSGVTVNNETGEVSSVKPGANPASAKEEEGSKVPYDYSSIELKVEGTYTTILDFLKELRKFPKMIAVNDVNFAPKQAAGSREEQRSPSLTATMDLTAVITKGGKDRTS